MKGKNKNVFKGILVLAFIILNFIFLGNQSLAVNHSSRTNATNKSAVVNAQSEYKIKLKVVTRREGYILTGGKIEVYSKDYTHIRDWYPDTEPELSLKPGVYRLWSTERNEAYLYFSPLKLTVKNNGVLEIKENNKTYLEGNTIICKASRKTIPQTTDTDSYNILKVDSEGDELAGAKFEVYEKNNQFKLIETFTSSIHSHSVDVKGSTTQIIKESQAPEGFEKISDFEVIGIDGRKIKLGANPNGDNVKLIDNTIIIKNKRKEKQVYLSKINEFSTRLAGGIFQIFEANDLDKAIAELTSTGSGQDVKTKLEYGKEYIVKEVKAPEGYNLVKDFKVSISRTGEISISGNDNNVRLEGDKLIIKEPFRKYPVNIKKVDEDGKALGGVEFNIYSKKSDGNYSLDDTWNSNTEYSKNLIPNEYKIEEISTPEGYEAINPFEFEVTTMGQIQLKQANPNVSVDAGTATITIKNKKKNIPSAPAKRSLRVTVHKLLLGKKDFDDWVSPDGYDASQDKNAFDKLIKNPPKEISGVYFVWKNDKDEYIDSEGNVVDSIDKAFGKLTEKNGASFDTSKLPDGTYRIYEVKEKSTYTGEKGEVLTEMKASPIEIKLPVQNKNGVVADVHVYPKNTENKPKIDKNFDETVTDPGVDNRLDVDNNQREKSKINRTIGDVIPYAVKTVIPFGSEYKKLTWTDNMTEGLTYDRNISIEGANLTTEDYYKLEDERGFSLSLKDSGLEKVKNACKSGDVELMIKYTASLNAMAVIDLARPQENTIALDYGNSPGKSSQPLELAPVEGKIKVDKSWGTAGNKQIPVEDLNMAVTYVLEEKVGDTYNEVDSVTLRYNRQNQDFAYEFTGLNNNKTYRVRERVGGYEPIYTSDKQGVLSITNLPNKTYIRPSNPKVETYGKKFVKVNTEDERLAGAVFAIKKDGQYLKAKGLGRRKQDKDLLKDAKNKILSAVDAYNNLKAEDLGTDAELNAKKLISDRQAAYEKAFENEGIGFEYTKDINDADLIKLSSNNDGQFMIRGLGAGFYELEELQAPKGYGKFKSLRFEIDVMSFNNGNIKYSNDDKTTTATKIINRKVIIPQAGGIGSLIFMAVGLCVMVYGLYRFRKASINYSSNNIA